jgi:hypothetical protein
MLSGDKKSRHVIHFCSCIGISTSGTQLHIISLPAVLHVRMTAYFLSMVNLHDIIVLKFRIVALTLHKSRLLYFTQCWCGIVRKIVPRGLDSTILRVEFVADCWKTAGLPPHNLYDNSRALSHVCTNFFEIFRRSSPPRRSLPSHS